MKSVLVLIPTNNAKAYCVSKFLQNLKKISVYGADKIHFLFSDDSRDDEHRKLIERMGYEVLPVTKTLEAFQRGEQVPIVQCLANARNALRNEFNKRDYTHALWIDSDVIPPLHVIPQLLSHDKDLVSGVYWQYRDKDVNGAKYRTLVPMLFKYKEPESVGLGIWEYADEIDVQELFPNRLLGGEDIPLMAFGTGCFMASKKLMNDDRWTFRYNPDKPNTTEDMWFSIDMAKLGYTLYADTNVCCRHYMNPWSSTHR